ncbi:MAG: M56 and DUF3738 domain-containing protein [Bryobacteraceae bacterium]
MIPSLFNHLWQSTVAAAVAGLLALALRRNHARVRYSIWFIASVKFLIPFSLLVALGSRFGWSHASGTAKQQFFFVMEQINQPFVPGQLLPPPVHIIRPAENFMPAILCALWLLGCAVVLLRWYMSWRRIHAAVRAGSRLNIDAPVRVLSSPATIEPGIFGIFRPVLLLPEGITEHLARAQFEAILAHELCHVRRRDNLAAAIHMLVQATFWFHPLVWWIGARLVEERERACDEEVLRMGSEPQIYAESILKTCEFYLESPLACMSGVTGADLKQRIVRIMTHRTEHNLSFARKLLLAFTGVAAIAGPIAYGLAKAPQSQTPPPAPGALPSFEVASIKPNKSGSFHSHLSDTDGRLTANNVSLRDYIERAFAVRAYQISGPEWLKSARYDIAAKPESRVNDEQFREMMQALLADRFKLVVHREQKIFPVYALVVAKNGPQLESVQSSGHSSANTNRGHLTVQGMSMAQFAEVLSRQTDRPVVDATGLKGAYNFKLEWTPDDKQSNRPEQADEAVTKASDAPSIFTAVEEQLGLKLEPRKAPAEILVIDHVEKVPTEN